MKCEEITLSAEFKNGITEEAVALFQSRLVFFEDKVRAIGVPFYQHEFDALVSLAFNGGPGMVNGSEAPKLNKHLKNKEYDLAPSEMLDITKAGGSRNARTCKKKKSRS